MATYKNRPDRQ